MLSLRLPCLIFAALWAAPAQPPVFRADTQLVLVGFNVWKDDAFVRDLRPGEIEILEDGEPRPLGVFEGGVHYRRTLPSRIVLLFDCSNSVRAAGLLDPNIFEPSLLAGYPGVYIGISGFTHIVRHLAAPTRHTGELEAAAADVTHFPPGVTRLYEAVIDTIGALVADRTPATRAVVVFSDSMAPPDRQPEAVRAARENDVALYPVLLARNPKDLFAAPGRLNPFERTSRTFLELAAPTGGREFRPRWSQRSVLPQILETVLLQAGAEYVAGYYGAPGEVRRGRRVEIRLRSPQRGEVRGGERSVTY